MNKTKEPTYEDLSRQLTDEENPNIELKQLRPRETNDHAPCLLRAVLFPQDFFLR
jgi:hypothetical protein